MVEQSAVNRSVAGSNPACGANLYGTSSEVKINQTLQREILNEESKSDSPPEEPQDESTQSYSIEVDSIQDDAAPYRQSQWAWLKSSFIWIIGLVVIIFFDFMSFGLIPILFAVAIAAPRYLRWKQTIYYLSETALFVPMVGLPKIQKTRIFKIDFDSMANLEPKFGSFGKTLGYADIIISFKDGRGYKVDYIADYENFIDHISDRTDLTGPEEIQEDPPIQDQ